MDWKIFCRLGAGGIFLCGMLSGCAGTDTDESLQARLALVELKLDALEGRHSENAPVRVDQVRAPEQFPALEANADKSAEPQDVLPVQTDAAVAPLKEPVSAPAEPLAPTSATPLAGGRGVVFLSQSAYADLTGAPALGVQGNKQIQPQRAISGSAEKAAPAKVAPQKKKPAAQKAKDVAQYEAALDKILAGKSAEGRQLMTDFMQQNPGSRLEPNALYWIGETWYSEKSYDKAILVFKDITTKFPKNDKAAAALYKLGACYDQLKDKGNAQFYWQALVEDFPKSEAAGLARKRLAAQ